MLRVFALKAGEHDFLEEAWKPYLSEGRKQEAARWRGESARRLFLGAEALLNRSLELVRPGIGLPVPYRRNEYGKPYLLSAADLYVNWSHSGEYALCAVADQETGVDLQYMGAALKTSLIRRALQPEELVSYEEEPEDGKRKRFYEYWTVKESYLKAVGTGFCMPLGQFYVCMDRQRPRIVQRAAEEFYGCRLLEFADRDYAAAVCCKGAVPEAEIEYL